MNPSINNGKEKIVASLNSVKKNLQHLINPQDLKEFQNSVLGLFNDKTADLNKKIQKDAKVLMKKFLLEKKNLEKMIDGVVGNEFKKVKKFVEDQKNEIEKIQERLETLIPQVKSLKTSSSKNKQKPGKPKKKAAGEKIQNKKEKKATPHEPSGSKVDIK